MNIKEESLVIIDTETTGLDLRHGCRPFMVAAIIEDEDGMRSYLWEWDVDPKTRIPLVVKEDLSPIQRLRSIGTQVRHNAKFDERAFETIGLPTPDWDRFHDTTVMSHTLDSNGSHKLKDLALQILDYPDDDQQELRDAVNEARRRGRKLGWRVAEKGDPHFPGQRSAPKDGWWVQDMWLPRAVAKHEKYPEDHAWWTICRRYCVGDVERTLGLYYALTAGLEQEGLQSQYETRRKHLGISYRMETQGITCSIPRLHIAKTNYTKRVKRSEAICKNLSPGLQSLRSPQQLQDVLFHEFDFEPVKHGKTGPSTDAETLEELQLTAAHRSVAKTFVDNLINFRKFGKAIEYLEAYERISVPTDHRSYLKLFPNFNSNGTATTRYASHDPNAQNISKKEDFNLREVFGPMPGREWYAMDYSNIELRIFAYESGDKDLIRAFEEGYSVHLIIAEILHPKEFAECKRRGEDFSKKYKATLYQWIKNGNFSLIYGAGKRKADATYRVDGAYDTIRQRLPKIDKFMRSKFEEAKRYGYVTTLGGYRLQVPVKEPHKAVNYFVQGSAGWAIIQAMIRVDEYLTTLDDYHMIMTIHDELDFDFPVHSQNEFIIGNVKNLMEASEEELGLPVPVDVERITKSWAHGEEILINPTVV